MITGSDLCWVGVGKSSGCQIQVLLISHQRGCQTVRARRRWSCLRSSVICAIPNQSCGAQISYGQEAEIVNALQEARRQTGINFADILYFDGMLALPFFFSAL